MYSIYLLVSPNLTYFEEFDEHDMKILTYVFSYLCFIFHFLWIFFITSIIGGEKIWIVDVSIENIKKASWATKFLATNQKLKRIEKNLFFCFLRW